MPRLVGVQFKSAIIAVTIIVTIIVYSWGLL